MFVCLLSRSATNILAQNLSVPLKNCPTSPRTLILEERRCFGRREYLLSRISRVVPVGLMMVQDICTRRLLRFLYFRQNITRPSRNVWWSLWPAMTVRDRA